MHLLPWPSGKCRPALFCKTCIVRKSRQSCQNTQWLMTACPSSTQHPIKRLDSGSLSVLHWQHASARGNHGFLCSCHKSWEKSKSVCQCIKKKKKNAFDSESKRKGGACQDVGDAQCCYFYPKIDERAGKTFKKQRSMVSAVHRLPTWWCKLLHSGPLITPNLFSSKCRDSRA